MPTQCKQLTIGIQSIKSLKPSLVGALDIRDVKEAERLKGEIETISIPLQEMLYPLEKSIGLKEQYQEQVNILSSVGILERLSTGEVGIVGIDGKEYPLPTYEQVRQITRENKEVLQLKSEQGFTKLLLVPFGMSLDTLIKKYKTCILKHHKDGKLFATKENPTDSDEIDELLELDESILVQIVSSEGYVDADKENKIVYRPIEFSENHQGLTKTEIINKEGAWQILLTEDMPNIPRQGKYKARTVGNRTQIDAQGTTIKQYIAENKDTPSPREYLKAIQSEPIYAHEEGMTPEEQIIYAISHLQQTNQVVDDWQGKGSISYQLGAYFPVYDRLPDSFWGRAICVACLSIDYPDNRSGSCGLRCVVRVKKS